MIFSICTPASGAVWRGHGEGQPCWRKCVLGREADSESRRHHGTSHTALPLPYGWNMASRLPPWPPCLPLALTPPRHSGLSLLPVTYHENRKIANTSGKEFSQIHSQRVGRRPGLAERLFRASQPQSFVVRHLVPASEAKGTCRGVGGGMDRQRVAPRLHLC